MRRLFHKNILAASLFLLTEIALGGIKLSAASLSSPPNLFLVNVTQNTVQVTWESITNATRYELSLGTDSKASNRGRRFISGTTTTLTKLLPNTCYRIKIRAVVGGQAGNWSPLKEFHTQIPVMARLDADDVRDTSVHLIWSDRYSDLPDTYYEISYGTDPDSSSDGMRSTDKNFMTLNNLIPETSYYIKLRARNPKVFGPWSRPISITTLPYKSGTGTAPKGLTINDGGQTGVLISWQEDKPASVYDISYGTDPIAENMGILSAEEKTLTLKLSSNSHYFFKVRSIIKGVAGPWSAIQSLLTLPAKPRGLTVSAQTSDQVGISWQSLPGSRISRFYHINWGTDSKGTNLGSTVTANASYTFSRLNPSRSYYVRIRTVNRSGVSPWSKVHSFTTLLAGLSGVRISKLKQTCAEVKWDILPTAQAYEISYGSDIEARTHRLDEVSRPPSQIPDLIPNAMYYLKIRPLMPNRQPGAWSNIINFTTFSIPPKPETISLSEIGGTYVSLTWTPEDRISTYEVLLSTAESFEQNRPQVFNRCDIRLTPLKKNTNYSVKVRAVNLGGPGIWSSPLSFTTLPEIPPTHLNLSNLASHEAMLTWEGISGTAPTTYQIRVGPVLKTWRIISNNTAQTCNLSQLQPETKYRVQVRAQNNAGRGPWSRELTFQTPLALPERAPQNLAVDNITDISASLHWQAMKKVAGYHLSIGTNTDASNRGQEILKLTSYDLKSLIPNTTYFVKVRAYNVTGEGPWSNILLVTTRPTPPLTAPTQIKIPEVTMNSITLTWKTSPEAISYEVSMGTDAQGTNRGLPQSTNSPPYIFSDCKPATQYSVKVRSINRGGAGPWSRIIKATTLKK